MAICERSNSGEAAEDSSELAAKKRALENWIAHATRRGQQFIAWNRRLECSRSDAALYRCTARAHPCMIRHLVGRHNPHASGLAVAGLVSAIRQLC